MRRRADRGGEDLGVEIVVVVDRPDLDDQVHAVGADVVEAADEGRDVAGPAFGGQQGLGGGEAQRHVGGDALVGELAAGDQAVAGQRHLDHNIGRDAGQLATLVQHAGGVLGGDLGAHRPLHHAGGGEVLDGGHVGAVEEELHS